MARKKIREHDSKQLLKTHIARMAGLNLPINVAQVKEATNFVDLIAANPWLTQVSTLYTYLYLYSNSATTHILFLAFLILFHRHRQPITFSLPLFYRPSLS